MKRLDIDLLLKTYEYDPESGILFRKSPCKRWNKKPTGSKNTKGHLQTYFNGSFFTVHRIAWAIYYREDPHPMQIDHINRVKDDNRICNLRLASPSQQAANRGPKSDSVSGIKGVYFRERTNRWLVSCGGDHVGCFTSLEEAKDAYQKAAVSRYGEFAFVEPEYE